MSGPAGLAQCVVSAKGAFVSPTFLDIYMNIIVSKVKVTGLGYDTT